MNECERLVVNAIRKVLKGTSITHGNKYSPEKTLTVTLLKNLHSHGHNNSKTQVRAWSRFPPTTHRHRYSLAPKLTDKSSH